MLVSPNPPIRSGAETKARILLVAQNVFSTKGYSHAGLREVAREAEVAPSLLIKYFGTKAKLFEEALNAAIPPLDDFLADRSKFGAAIVNSVLDPGRRMSSPAMIALSLGDPESRAVAVRVVRERILGPLSNWLGSERAQARALNVFMMTTGFSIFARNMDGRMVGDADGDTAKLFSEALQRIVDFG